MKLAADGLARFIRERCKLPEKTRVEYATKAVPVANLGDITGMLKLSAHQGVYGPQSVEVGQVLLPDGRFWQPNDDADILFLGDSFANVFSFAKMGWGEAAGFAERLSVVLGRPLDVIVRNAGGSYATRETLSAELRYGTRDRLAGKALVVWEFAARDLSSGDWKMLDMAFNREAWEKKRAEQPPTDGEITVLATVTATSLPPPTDAPYDEAVTYTQYKVVNVEAGTLAAQTLVAIEWTLKKRKLLASAKYKPGDVLRLRLVPYAQHLKANPDIEKVQAINDLEDLESDLFWTVEAAPAR